MVVVVVCVCVCVGGGGGQRKPDDQWSCVWSCPRRVPPHGPAPDLRASGPSHDHKHLLRHRHASTPADPGALPLSRSLSQKTTKSLWAGGSGAGGAARALMRALTPS